MPKKITFEDLVTGDGPVAERGKNVTIRYSGFLRKGDTFQKSTTANFKLGERRVIAGLEYGVEGMRVGGVRRITVPPHLAYREAGVPGVIPPNALLIFEVELLNVS